MTRTKNKHRKAKNLVELSMEGGIRFALINGKKHFRRNDLFRKILKNESMMLESMLRSAGYSLLIEKGVIDPADQMTGGKGGAIYLPERYIVPITNFLRDEATAIKERGGSYFGAAMKKKAIAVAPRVLKVVTAPVAPTETIAPIASTETIAPPAEQAPRTEQAKQFVAMMQENVAMTRELVESNRQITALLERQVEATKPRRGLLARIFRLAA